ncbi:E1A-binding protein p400-like [Uranotaenia lowii]|uniref:E1A-binding protein p400-like n=1 Tax=Uranotaenia lowii TaxID=190385 RepID=UPI00247A5FE8|nr:E1A-binding protein p400-like [Uranotaenia lowii]
MYRHVFPIVLVCLFLGVRAQQTQQQQQKQQQQQSVVTPPSKPLLTISEQRPVLENPAYDPTLYQQFLPQDAIQQYVQSYTGSSYSQPNRNVYGSSGFESSGFDGFLIPAPTRQANPIALVTPESHSSWFGSVRSVIPTARTVATFFGQLISLAFGSLSAVAVATILTSLLCFFTPFCTLTFRTAKLVTGETASEVIQAIGEQVTAERVKRAAEFVRNAIDKFQALNQVVREVTERKAAEGTQFQ